MSKPHQADRLRVALLAGVLGQGGAEKQFVYMARALMEMGADVRVYSLTRGDHHEPALQRLGLEPVWIGRQSNPIQRLFHSSSVIRGFGPHIVQAGHFFTNAYVAFAALRSGALGIGSIRNDAFLEMKSNGLWGPVLLRSPRILLANSDTARRNAISLGRDPARVLVLHNVIDDSAFGADRVEMSGRCEDGVVAMVVCRLVAAKRVDRFLHALARAREGGVRVRGVVVGDGPERVKLQSIAICLGLTSDAVEFTGARTDVPTLMKRADILALSSDHEGFPNVLLEAMASGLPIVTTPAGDAGTVVQNWVTGFVVPFDDVECFADRLQKLASSSTLRRSMGAAGRVLVEERYGIRHLADRLRDVYLEAAHDVGDKRLEESLKALFGSRIAEAVSPRGTGESVRAT